MRGEWTGGRVSEEDERLLEQFQSGVTRIKKARRRGRGRDGRGIAQEGRGSRGGRVLTGLDKNLHGSCGEQRCAREVLERDGCILGLLTSPTRKTSPDFPKPSFKTAHFRALFRRAFSNRESVWIHVMFTVTTFYLYLYYLVLISIRRNEPKPSPEKESGQLVRNSALHLRLSW